MAARLALALVVLAALAPAYLRPILESPPPPGPCDPVPLGRPPRGWLGCAADHPDAARRPPTGEEALALGLPLDPNTASARDLAFVPGLSPALGAAIVADRRANGLFLTVDDLERVRGVGPGRLARARPHLAVAP